MIKITEGKNRFWLINSKVETWLSTIAFTARFANDHLAPIALEALIEIQPILKYIGVNNIHCDRVCRIQNKNFELEIYLNSMFLVPNEYAVDEYEENYNTLPIITVRE